MGGGGGSNSAMVAEQQRQAEEARQKELQRQARLTSGQQAIDYLFNGMPTGAQQLDLSSLAGMNPDGFSFGGSSGRDGDNFGRMSLDGGYYVSRTPDNGLGKGFGVYDGQGNLVTQAQTLKDLSSQKVYWGGDPNNRTGGFGDEFYNKFRQAQLGYYMPEVQRQYNNARMALTTGLARSGNLRSTTAGNNLADLIYQNDTNRAQLTAKADSATGDLRQQVATNRQAAINQLYATEDPSLAANTATSMVRNVELTQPDLNPLGQLFSPIIAGIGSGLQSYGANRAYNTTTSSPSASSGKIY
jgi:hypothetical protein